MRDATGLPAWASVSGATLGPLAPDPVVVVVLDVGTHESAHWWCGSYETRVASGPKSVKEKGMATPAGDLKLLDHPLAQRLLSSTEPAQLAYTWLDGTPRTVPIWFHWDGEAIVLTSPPRAPKLTALRTNPQVALTIDEHVWPYKVLYIRGVASIDMLDDISPEYAIAAERYFGADQGKAWVEQLRGLPSARIKVTPQWANVIDFETRLPSALG
jgi:hypothetical protein